MEGCQIMQFNIEIIHVLAQGEFVTHNRELGQPFSAWKLKPFRNAVFFITP